MSHLQAPSFLILKQRRPWSFTHIQNGSCKAKIMWAYLQCIDKKGMSGHCFTPVKLYLNKASVIKMYFQVVSGAKPFIDSLDYFAIALGR